MFIKRIVFLFVLFSFSSVFAASYYVDATNGVDPTVNGFLIGSSTWTSSGKFGNALTFDGKINVNATSYVDLGQSSILKPAQFTISAWVFGNSTTTSQTIFKPSYCDSFVQGFAIYLDGSGNARFRYGNGTSFVGSINTAGTDYRGAWHLISATFDGATTTLYVDGVAKVASSTPTLAYSSTANSAQIGGAPGSNSFNGKIDDVRFYSRALSSGEVSNIFSNTNIATTSMIFYMPFEEGSGTYTLDAQGNSGTSSGAPWKTLAQVSAFQFQPGDSILLNKGQVWRESLTVPSSGSAGNPITFGSYGTGAQPQINAAKLITGWVNYSGNIYTASSSPVSQLFVDGGYYDVARYPNSGYEIITQTSATNTYIVDSALSLTPSQVAGSYIYMRDQAWHMSKVRATSFSTSTHQINFTQLDANLVYVPTINYGYYLTGQLWMLDQPGEWYYDATSSSVYLWLNDSSNPSGHTVEGSYYDRGIYAANKSYLTFQDLDVRNASSSDIELNTTSSSTLQNLTISNSAQRGIYAYGAGSGNITVTNSTFSSSTLAGIHFANLTGSPSSITNNTITNTGLSGMPKYTQQGTAVKIETSNNISVLNNSILNNGYIGVWYYGNNNLVKYNKINGFCIALSDCGGIYTYGNFGTNNLVTQNIIANSTNNISGSGFLLDVNEGIYLDDNSNGSTLSNNTISNTGHGIFLHDTYNNTVTGNNIYRPRLNDLWIQEGSVVASGTTINNVITGNIFSPGTSTAATLYSAPVYGFSNFGTYNSNFLSSVYVTKPVVTTIISTTTNYTLSQWQASSSQDSLTKDIASFYQVATATNASTLDDDLLVYNDTTSTQYYALDGQKYCDVNNNQVSSLNLGPFSSKVLFSCFNNNDGVCNNNETHDTAPTDCPAAVTYGGGGGGGQSYNYYPPIVTSFTSGPNLSPTTTPATSTPIVATTTVPTTIILGSGGTTSPYPYLGDLPSLYYGNRGWYVRQLQIALTLKLGTSSPLAIWEVNGVFGPKTLQSLRQFQCSHQIVCSGTTSTTGWGVFGKRTKAEMMR